MDANWIATAVSLPDDGETVEFLLDRRECPMRGIYMQGRFESRWTQYAPTSVRQWRNSANTPARVPAMAAFRHRMTPSVASLAGVC